MFPTAPAPDDTPYLPRRFTPVPRASLRRDGWTADRQYAFIAALTRLPSVAAAARSVGMQPRSAHRLRCAAGAEDFACAWDEAIEIGLTEAGGVAIERAVGAGALRPVRYRGRVVGHEVRHDDRLLLAALNAYRAKSGGRLPHQKRLALRRERAEHAAEIAQRLADIALEDRIEAAVAPLREAERRRIDWPPAPPRIRAL